MIDDVLRELEAVGQVDSEGEFTLDRAKGREKMRRFQLADPRAYVLELVQAAALKGATVVTFAIDSRDMVMELDGRPFTAADFDDIYGAALTRRLDPDVLARRQLALGVNSAMALRPTRIVVESGDGQHGARLRLAPDEEDAIEALETTRVGTRIHVRERFSLGTFSAFFKNLAGSLAEEQLLRAKCGYASFAIDLEGTRLDRGLALDPYAVVDVIELQREHTRVVCGLSREGEGPALVHIVKDGVWITTHELPAARFPAGFLAVVQDHAVRKDVSQSDIVRDEAYQAMVAVLLRACHTALAALATRQLAGPVTSWSEPELLRQLEQLAQAGAVHDADEPTGLVRALVRLPLWETTGQRSLTLEALLAEAEAKGSVAFTSKSRFEGLLPPNRSFVVHLVAPPKKGRSTPADPRRRILEHVLGLRLHDVTAQLDSILRREHARRAWRARPVPPVLREGAYLCRRTVEGPGVRGEIGITDEPTDRAHVVLVVQGCLLTDDAVKMPWLGLRIVVEADAFRPSESFQRIERTTETYVALMHVAAAIPALYGDLAQVTEATPWRDACAMSFLEALLRGDSLLDLFTTTIGKPNKSLDAALESFGAGRLRLDPGLDSAVPHPTLGMPLLPTLGPRRFSLLELFERARRDEPIRVVAKATPGIEADILVLDLEAQEHLQPLFARRFVDASGEVTRLARERDFLRKPEGPTTFDAAPPAVLVVVQGEGITGILQVVPSGRAAGPRSIEVYHRERPLDTVQLWLAGECKGWVQSSAVTPTADFRYVKDDAALDEARAAVLRAFASACLRVAERSRAEASPDDLAFLREVTGLPFPGKAMRAAYDQLRAAKDATPVQVAEIHQRLYAAMHVQRDPEVIEERVSRLSRSKTPIADALSIPAPKRSHRWALAAVDVLFPPGPAPHDLARRALRPAAPLSELPLFRHHDGRGLTIDALRVLDERKQVLQHTDELVALDLGERTMALVDPSQLESLRRLMGSKRVLDGRMTIAEARRRQELASRVKVERIVLPPGAAVVSVRFDVAKGWRVLEGEVGLCSDHPGDASQEPRLRLTSYVEHAEIERLAVDGGAAHLVAAANDDRLPLAVDHKSVVRGTAFDQLVAQCHAQVPALMTTLVERWPQLTPFERRTAWYHLLDFLVAHPPAALEAWGHAGAVDDTFAKVAAVPGFTGVGGVLLSAVELVRAHVRNGRLEVLAAPYRMWGESPLPPDRPVVCADPYELAALRSLLPEVESVEEPWVRWQQREHNRNAALPAHMLDEAQLLVWHDVAMEGLQGRLAIPLAGQPLTIELCAEGKVVEARALASVLPCWGTVSGPMIVPDPMWSVAILDGTALQALRSRSLELYEKLARWLVAHEEHPEHGRVASLLADQVVALRRAERAGPLPDPAARLLEELRTACVLALPNGRRISLHTALQEQPGALGHLDLWDAPGHRLQQLYGVSATATPAPVQEPPAAPASTPRRGGRLMRTRAVEPTPAPAPRGPTPEDRLVDALRAELGLVRERNERLLADVHLDRIHVRPLSGDARALVAQLGPQGVIVNRDHPAVKRALALREADPVWCSYVASAVYTALNVWLTEITDADERSFLDHLARLVSGR